jgi:predicted amidophosphoribosyltransferase
MSNLFDLLLPTPCILCQKIGPAMCSKCVSSFEIRTNKLAKGFISGYSFSDYSSESAAVVNAVKEQGQTSLLKFMAEFMFRSWPEEYREVQLVPVPSSPLNLKRRGFSHTELLAKKLSLGLDSVRVTNLLRSVKPRVDQVGLSFPEREQNLIGAFKGDLQLWRDELGPVVLIDDVFTSGATLSQAWQSLEDLGVVVAGFCVFAQITPRKPLFTGQERLS